MPSHGQLPTNNNAARGLPTVKPPSGRFILQLFLIPGLIVAGLVVVFVFGSLLWVGTSTPESYLSRLDNTNPDVRWRAAHDLAQVLKRPESLELASDPDFALDLSERLLKALAELEQAEEAEARDVAKTIEKIKLDKGLTEEQKVERGDAASKSARAKYRAQRHYVWYLISCLGDFTVPVGVNALDTVLRKKEAADLEGLSMRRTRAVLALANLGNNMKQRFFGIGATTQIKALAQDQKSTIRSKLIKAATAEVTGERARMADYAHGVLFKKQPSRVDEALYACAKSDDLDLREATALALYFWDGPLVEPTLLLLAKDDGHGKRYLSEKD